MRHCEICLCEIRLTLSSTNSETHPCLTSYSQSEKDEPQKHTSLLGADDTTLTSNKEKGVYHNFYCISIFCIKENDL